MSRVLWELKTSKGYNSKFTFPTSGTFCQMSNCGTELISNQIVDRSQRLGPVGPVACLYAIPHPTAKQSGARGCTGPGLPLLRENWESSFLEYNRVHCGPHSQRVCVWVRVTDTDTNLKTSVCCSPTPPALQLITFFDGTAGGGDAIDAFSIAAAHTAKGQGHSG
ncbi:hypothetical protein ACFE04_019798 [Oxalis oulophora]